MGADEDKQYALIVAGDHVRDEYARRMADLRLAVRSFADCELAVASLDERVPVVAVLEVEDGGFRMCRELHDRFANQVPIILVSHSRVEPFDAVAGFMIGADEYAAESMDAEEFLARVRRLLQRASSTVDAGPDPLRVLTARERQVLEMLAAGRTQKQVAMLLGISSKTVGAHVQNTLAKLGLHSRVQAVSLAVRAAELRTASGPTLA